MAGIVTPLTFHPFRARMHVQTMRAQNELMVPERR
jgi:hypothetical protein